MAKPKRVTVELTQQEFIMLENLRAELKQLKDSEDFNARIEAFVTKYEYARITTIKKDYEKEFGTDPMIDFVKDAEKREIGERFVECISKELLIELYLQYVPERDIKEWFSLWEGRNFMVERLIDRKITSK